MLCKAYLVKVQFVSTFQTQTCIFKQRTQVNWCWMDGGHCLIGFLYIAAVKQFILLVYLNGRGRAENVLGSMQDIDLAWADTTMYGSATYWSPSVVYPVTLLILLPMSVPIDLCPTLLCSVISPTYSKPVWQLLFQSADHASYSFVSKSSGTFQRTGNIMGGEMG